MANSPFQKKTTTQIALRGRFIENGKNYGLSISVTTWRTKCAKSI